MEAKTLNDGRVVVDGMCKCGHKQSEHYGDRHHGGYKGPTIVCQQYTWVGFVFDDGTVGI